MSGSTMVSRVSVWEYLDGLRSGDSRYTKQGLRELNWRGQDLDEWDLSGLDLYGLDMKWAYLREADLSGANLSGADLSEAKLNGADLSGADLSDADLRRADLSGAKLCGANLSGADLSGANLRGANLREADLSEANLSDADLGEADLSGANLRGAVLNWDQIPLVVNIDATILSTLEGDGTLDMADWHTCDTTHCRAGWAVVLAGDAGRKLEEQLGTNAAAALIYTKSGSHPVPNWYADNKTALEDIKARAEHQLAASQLISLEEKGIEIG